MKIRLALEGFIDKIPDGDATNPEFVEWCESWGLVPSADYSRARGCNGDFRITRKDAYIVHLDHGGYIALTEEEFREAQI